MAGDLTKKLLAVYAKERPASTWFEGLNRRALNFQVKQRVVFCSTPSGVDNNKGVFLNSFLNEKGEKMSNKTVIVYGPAACGKTTNAKKLANKYGCRNILDGWDGRGSVPAESLVLTVEHPPYENTRALAVSYEEAIK